MSERSTYELTRSTYQPGAPMPRARIAHFGLGAFHRAHQVWFTAHSDDGAQWGICAFSGRTSGVVDVLRAQDGLYTLIERSGDGDRFEVMTNLVEMYDGTDSAAIIDVLARPEIAIITTTVSEAGYRLNLDGTPKFDDAELARDIEALRRAVVGPIAKDVDVTTVPGRILLGLDARRRASAGPLAIVPCDNLPDNGPVLERGITELATRISAELARWIGANVTFVSTSVDRITPRTTKEDLETVLAHTRRIDASPVVTEPFASWILSGEFPGGRPRWEAAGARFVADIEPYERRKLWLLNGAHSLLAYVGLEHGHTTVAEAIADPGCRVSVESFWQSARRHLPADLDLDFYEAQLLERFENARIDYQLEQIATDAVMKLRTRIAPVLMNELREGRDCPSATEALRAWVVHVLERGSFPDAERSTVESIVSTSSSIAADLIRLVEPGFAQYARFLSKFDESVQERMASRGALPTENLFTPGAH